MGLPDARRLKRLVADVMSEGLGQFMNEILAPAANDPRWGVCSAAGNPMQDGDIGSFNGHLRDKCLKQEDISTARPMPLGSPLAL